MGKRRLKDSEVAGLEENKRRLRTVTAQGKWAEGLELLKQIGNQHRLFQQYEDAIDNHKKEIDMCRLHLSRDKGRLSIAYRNMTETYIDMKKVEKALQFGRLYLDTATEAGNFVEEQRAMITMGRALLINEGEQEGMEVEVDDKKRKEYKEAEQWFRKAYGLLSSDDSVKEQLKNDKEFMDMKCNNCQNLAVALDLQGNNEQAIKWYQKAIEIGRKEGLLEYLYPCHLAMFNLQSKKKEWDLALSHAKQGCEIAIKMGSLTSEVEAKILLAKAYFLCDRILDGKKLLKTLRKRVVAKKEVEQHLEEVDALLIPAVKLSRRLDQLFDLKKEASSSTKLMEVYEKIADFYTELNVFHLAIDSYLNALKYGQMVKASAKKLTSLYFSIAESYKDDGDNEKALEYYGLELSMHDDDMADEKFLTQTRIAQVYEKSKSVPETVKAYEEAIILAVSTRNPKKRLLAANQGLGIYLKSVGDDRAENYLKNAQELKDEMGEEAEADSQEVTSEGGDSQKDSEDEVYLDNLSSDDEDEEDSNELKNVAQAKKRLSRRCNEAGETPVHLAAKRGDLNAIRKYIKQGFSVNDRDTAGWTPLHEAANFGNATIIEFLLKNGARVNDSGGALCEGITPIHDALSNGHLEAAEVLLENGAEVLKKDNHGNFPIDHLIIWRCGLETDKLKVVHEDYKRIKQLLKNKMREAGRPYTSQDEARAIRKGPSRPNGNTSPEYTVLEDRSSCLLPVVIAQDTFDPDNVEQATKEYQNTMKCLQKRKRSSASPENKRRRRRCALSPGPRTALIPSDKDVHDNWLLPDGNIQPSSPEKRTRRRRRPRTPSPSSRSSSPSLNDVTERNLSDSNLHVGEHEQLNESHAMDEEEDDPLSPIVGYSQCFSPDREEDESTVMFQGSPSPPPKPTRSNHQSSDEENSSPLIVKHKSSRLRTTSSSRKVVLDSDDDDQVIIEDVRTPVKKKKDEVRRTHLLVPAQQKIKTTLLPRSNSNASIGSATSSRGNASGILRLKIKVKDQSFLVPVGPEDQKRSIKWLCEQAAVRYNQRYGVKPHLDLYTTDGALIWEQDTIDQALIGEDEIIGKIKQSDVPSAVKRYSQLCNDLGVEACPAMVTALNEFESSGGTLSVVGVPLKSKDLSILFQSIEGNMYLKKLRLEQCSLFDSDVNALTKILSSLNELMELDLSSNAITTESIKVLSRSLAQQSNPLPALQGFILDFNLLEDDVGPYLMDCIKFLPSLKTLGISYNYLTDTSKFCL